MWVALLVVVAATAAVAWMFPRSSTSGDTPPAQVPVEQGPTDRPTTTNAGVDDATEGVNSLDADG